jgi:homopolymeric O-antigen transport system ATP-binding protein
MITVEQVSKKYQIGGRGLRYRMLRESLVSLVQKSFGLGSPQPHEEEFFFALKDVSFHVGPGEVVGIVGRNGAGKSTLLKILSRITRPSTGHAALYGRVGSLLEASTGFHPELTGRENIFLRGAILGMPRMEVRRKFDEIVEFANTNKFIDTMLKHYSSGMSLRLAFAVAAHLDTDILLVDEALAVGDAEFQKRCQDKIQEVVQQGRTVLFVSHSMQMVTRLCKRAILLESGKILLDGDAHHVAATYLQINSANSAHRYWHDAATAPGDECVRLRSVRVRAETGETVETRDVTQPFGIEIEYEVLTDGHIIVPRLEFCNAEGACLFWSFEVDSEWHRRKRPAGCYITTAWLPKNFCTEGSLQVGVTIYSFRPWMIHLNEARTVSIQIIEPSERVTARGDYAGHIPGFVRPLLRWTSVARERITI